MMKRIIALLLALILTVGLLPTVALAAEGDAGAATAPADVIDGYYDDNNEWTKGKLPQSTVPGVQAVSKTAKPTSNPNEYEVELKVVLKQTEENSGKAATVLVLDTSGSMAYCAECGAEPEEDCEHNYVPVLSTPSETGTYYYKYTNKNGQVEFGKAHYCNGQHTFKEDHPAGWFKTKWYESDHNTQGDALSANNLYRKKPRASRLDAAKVGAENFLKTYSGLTFKTDGTVAANQNSRNLGRYVSVVSFATGAALKQEWVDVSNADNYQTVLNTIKALKADGGTNLDAGLTYAEYLLKQTTVNDAVKNVIALTDGQPTFFIDTNMNAYDDDGLKYLNRKFLTIDKTQYRVHGTGDSCNEKTFTETVASADAVKNRAKLYTVCFDAEEKIDVPNSKNQISVSAYLSTKIATQPTKTGEQFAYDADNAEKLYAEFAKITQSIVSGLSTGTVKDTLPTGITSEAFGKDKVKEWKLNEAPFTKNETPNTVGGKQVTTYTYTYTYTVTIDPDDENLVKTKDGYAPLNGKTTLTVKNSQGKDVEIPFPIPAGKVTPKQYTVTGTIDNNGTVNSAASPYTETVESGKTSKAMTFTPAAGYEIKTITEKIGDGQPTPITFTDKNSYTYDAKTVTADITVTVTTQKRTDLSYSIKYVEKGTTNEIMAPTTVDNQEFGAEIVSSTITAPEITGFKYDSRTPNTLTIGADVNQNVITLYYTRNEYKVTYEYTGDIPTNPAPTPVPSEATCKYEANVMIAAAPAPVSGYTFEGWKREDGTEATNFTMPANDVKITGNWKKNGDGTYKLEYWLEKLDGTYENTETITGRTGTIGTTASVTEADKKQISGFTFDADNVNNVLSDTISADGSLTLKLYYTRNSYKVTYQYTGTVTPEDATKLPDEATYKYGAEVTVAAAATSTDYIFSGWSRTDTFNMPAENVTITGSWTLKDPTAVNVDLNNHIYKTFTSDTADIPNGKLTFNVAVRDISDKAASMTRSGSVEFTKQDVTTSKAFTFAGDQLTFTAAGEYTFEVVEDTTTTINGLTYNVGNGTHTFTIVVDKKANTNELEVKKVRVGTAEYTGNALTAELAYATITNNYVEPKKTFDLNNTIFKTFTPVAGGLPIPTGEGISYTFTARMTEQTEEGFAVGSNGRNYTLKATLTGEVIEANKVPFTVEGASEVSFAPGTYYFLVQEDSTAAVTGTVNGTIHNDSQAYLLTLTVKEDLSFETEVKETAVAMSLEEPTPGLGTITFNNTYEEKEPGKYTIKFSDLIVKCLTKEGSKAFTGAEFTANVTGWKYMKEEAKPWAMLANATSFAFTDLPSRTLTATFLADAVFNPDNEAYRPFTGDTLTVEEGDYLFLIEENNGGQSNITYDEAKYWLAVRVRFEDDEPIVAVYRRTYTARDSYNTVFENETKWSDPIPANITPVTFYNTIDTGKDDYYPIIIPTIIGKDTGMLNKTDHFAYVIGYPDGTVHPNGQITRAEVATIFFRLLRDEVRDGAFTTSNTYSDVAYGKWYNNPISTMSALGIITGYPDGTFKPNKPITRAEFAAIAARFDETQSGKSATFSDVIGHWAAKEIGIAYYNDWIKGYPDGTFKPDQNITRAEAMTLINRVLERKPESPADLLTNMNKWTDNLDTSKWYYLDVQEATNSHGYTRKTFNYELWRQMLPDPDWSRYER